ncbi:MAG: serine/threonine protein kinase [Verrucomicrobiales bacterium]|nr:serine/threonine protein kinase [Verrucomicrobiales bacterium]
MSTPESAGTPHCPQCGTDLPGDAPAGHCPHCLLRASIETSRDHSLSGQDPTLVFQRHVGDYELIAEIARGGMGVVYRARQRSLGRLVAVKMLLGGEFAGPDEVRRFQREAEAAARLRHPNIVAIHEFGWWEGQRFLAMELIQGRSLADWVRDGPMPSRRAAGYLRAVAEAVAFAHAQGILHRDLKPSNVLIDAASDQPRITDFGLAKHLEQDRSGPADSGALDRLTLSGYALGSPAYMAPEQAAGSANIGPGTDVYALGALLYHLISGRPPFQSDSIAATLRQVLESDPVPPRQLNPSIPLDLQTVCLKCLEKSPDRRYPSAWAFVEELDRFLAHVPIQARPLGLGARVAKFCRRRPAIAVLGLAVLALAVTIPVIATIAAWRVAAAREAENLERQRFIAANRELRHAVSLLELQRAEEAFRAHDPSVAVAHLASLLRREPTNQVAASRLVSALVDGRWISRAGPAVPHGHGVRMVAFSPDDRQILSVTRTSRVDLREASTGRLRFTLAHEGPVVSGRFSPDGRRLVTASFDGTARVWSSDNGAPLIPPLRHAGPVRWAEFSPDSQRLVTASDDHTAVVWNAVDGARIHTLSHPGSKVVRACFRPDGNQIATATERGEIRLWTVESGETRASMSGLLGQVHALTYSPDGLKLAAAGDGGRAMVWSVADPQAPGLTLHHAVWAPVWHITFSPDSAVVLTAAEDTVARLWDAATGFPLSTQLVHEGGVVYAAFSPDGTRVVTTSADVSARLWDWRSGQRQGQPMRHRDPVRWAAFTSDGRGLITASDDETTQYWRLPSHVQPTVEIRHSQGVTVAEFLENHSQIFTASLDQTARLWDARTGESFGEPMQAPAAILCAGVDPDSALAALGCIDGSVGVWDLRIRQRLAEFRGHTAPIQSVRFSQDAKAIVTASEDGSARVWQPLSGQPITPPLAHLAAVRAADFSSDGRRVATASDDASARVWDASTGHPVTPPLRHGDHVKGVHFSRDGLRIVTASTDNTARIWDVASGRVLVPPLQHERIVEAAWFTPDDRRVVTVSQDRTARVWDADTGQALTPPLLHSSAVSHLVLSRDGRRMLTGAWNSLARVWDVETGLPLSEWFDTAGFPTAIAFDASGHWIATCSQSGMVRCRRVPTPPVPVPGWFMDLAEAVAGTRVSERGHLELLPHGEFESASMAGSKPDQEGFYERVGRWIQADPSQRPSTPY